MTNQTNTVDPATGERGGSVVGRGMNVPLSASRLKCGSLPSAMYFFTNDGSMPSSPSTTKRLIRALAWARRCRIRRAAQRIGHRISAISTEKKDRKEAMSVVPMAISAPGPI